MPLASDANLDITGFLYRSLEFLRKELSYSGSYKPSDSGPSTSQLSDADRERFFDAMQVLWSTRVDDGRTQYGDAYVDLCERGLARMTDGGSLVGISSPGCTVAYKANLGYDMPGSGKCVMEYAMRLIALRCAGKGVNCNVVRHTPPQLRIITPDGFVFGAELGAALQAALEWSDPSLKALRSAPEGEAESAPAAAPAVAPAASLKKRLSRNLSQGFITGPLGTAIN